MSAVEDRAAVCRSRRAHFGTFCSVHLGYINSTVVHTRTHQLGCQSGVLAGLSADPRYGHCCSMPDVSVDSGCVDVAHTPCCTHPAEIS